MSIEWVKGDLLESNVDYICHQVNCQGRMGSGIAKSIKEKWPIVYDEYQKFCSSKPRPEMLLGEIQKIEVDPHDAIYIINMFSQLFYGYDGKRYTSYDAFWCCLGQIKERIPKGRSIGFPKRIGCGLGGANWKVIETMIFEALAMDYKVYIYELED